MESNYPEIWLKDGTRINTTAKDKNPKEFCFHNFIDDNKTMRLICSKCGEIRELW